MALGDNTGGHIFLNIKEGKLSFKDRATSERKTCGYVSGFITEVRFEMKEWEGKKYEQATFTIVDGDEKYLLQTKTRSGYFKAICNQLRSGDPKKKVKITPNYKQDGAKKMSGAFVEQDGKTLPWYSKKTDPKDVPPMKPFELKGETVWDDTDQINYWKNWLSSAQWASEFEASAVQYENKPSAIGDMETPPAKTTKTEPTFTVSDDDDDLPF